MIRTSLTGLAFGFAWLPLVHAAIGWPEYNGGPDRNHFSPARQITPANVGRLKVAWEFHSRDFGSTECNPIEVAGILYATTPSSDVVALDGASGRQLWRFSAPHQNSALNFNRGVAYWAEGADRRILCSVGPYLYALDAGTGRPIPTFGTDGRASLKAGLGPQAQDKWLVSTTPGTVFGDLIIMPTRVGEDEDAAPGWIQAFNLRTGTLAWTFITIPYPGENGHETWPGEAYRNERVGAANCWAGMAIDRGRGILYVPTGSASPDFWGGDRIGQDLYSDCLLALDAATGKLLWHYQFVHHDLWDRDLPAPPNLVTVRRNGKTVAAVAQVTKSGYVFVFDRASGAPLFPIEEVAAPPSPLRGEVAWPTQPRPAAPPPFVRQSSPDIPLSPYAHNRAELAARLKALRAGPFQPLGTDDTLVLPGYDGGAEWGGAAADLSGILYVNANDIASIGSLRDVAADPAEGGLQTGRQLYERYCQGCHGEDRQGQPKAGIPSLSDAPGKYSPADLAALIATGRKMMPPQPSLGQAERKAIAAFVLGAKSAPVAAAVRASRPKAPFRFKGYEEFADDRGYPAIAPPWGTLTAMDLNSGRQLWQIPLGNYAELSPAGSPPTGTGNYGGPVVTASGLLFIAATADSRIRALDRRTGRQLWEAPLPAAGFATPCVYELGGREFVVIACGGQKLGQPAGDAYVAFALP